LKPTEINSLIAAARRIRGAVERHGDLQDIVRAVKAKGAALKAAEQPIDTSTAAGKCFLDMLGVFAELETNLKKSGAGGIRGRARRQDPQASDQPTGVKSR
jgi:DNA invertase Pin-like site-specific DNA recombinase